MDPERIAQHLRHVATRYDRARFGKRGYNPYALGIYLQRIDDEVLPALRAGVGVEDALRAAFSDRLLDAMLKGARQIA